MLVQKGGLSKRTIILLAVFGVIVLGGGYFVYTNYFASSSSSASVSPSGDAAATQTASYSVPAFDDSIFSDPEFLQLQRERFAGFTDQYETIALNKEIPLSVKNAAVLNPAVGRQLIVQWQLPEYINFTAVAVYRSQNPGTVGEQITTMEVGGEAQENAGKLMSFKDTAVKDNQAYYYLIRTVNSAGDESVNDAQVNAIATDELPPDPPSRVSITPIEDGQVRISWARPADEDFDKVRIYRSRQKGVVGEIVYYQKIEQMVAEDGQTKEYIVDTIDTNTTYYYTITSVDTSNNESTKNILATPNNYNPFQPFSGN